MRWQTWAVAVSIGLTTIVTPAAAGTATPHTSFACLDGIGFDVEQSDGGKTAIVRTGSQDFTLKKNPSALGERYSSSEATLIIDGDFAAFVTDRRSDFRQCRSAGSRPVTASAPARRRR